jgi:hypothetical protein
VRRDASGLKIRNASEDAGGRCDLQEIGMRVFGMRNLKKSASVWMMADIVGRWMAPLDDWREDRVLRRGCPDKEGGGLKPFRG